MASKTNENLNMVNKKKGKKKKKIKPTEDSDSAVVNNHETNGGGGEKKLISDPRFASVHSDPRFQKVRKHESKVEIDSRFNRMFTDKSFVSSSAPLDSRGKAKKQKSDSFLKNYYRIEEEDEEKKVSSEEEEEGEEIDDVAVKSDSSSELDASELDDDDVETTTDEEEVVFEEDGADVAAENIPTIEDGTRRLAVVNLDWRHVRAVDLYVVLRSFLPKGGDIVYVAVYPSEFGLQRMKEEELHGPVGLFDNEKKNNNNNNVDDDEAESDGEDEDEDENKDDEINEDKLREYERSRLRYYYAVVECDSVATAEHLYNACDGVEFERSSNMFDLRFIPDSMEFRHPPRDVAKEAPASYEGLDFHTKALQHSNIPISWDEDEPQRVKTLKRKFTADQLAELELQEFLASDESESEEVDDNDDDAEDEADKKQGKRDKYRALIFSGDGSDGENEDEDQDMEITFHTGLEGLSKRILEKRDKKTETVWEVHLRKQQEKKKARKNKSKHLSEDDGGDADEEMIEEADDFFVEEPTVKKHKDSRAKSKKEGKRVHDAGKEAEASQAELELLLADDNEVDNGVKGYNLKRKKAKGKREKEILDESKIPTVEYDDPRFSALFNSPLFALDPTDPQFKRSAAYARQIAQRQHMGGRRQAEEGEQKKQHAQSQMPSDDPDAGQPDYTRSSSDAVPSKEKHEISALVRSIKMKSKQVQLLPNGKSKKDEKLKFRGISETEKPDLSTQSIKKKAKIKQK